MKTCSLSSLPLSKEAEECWELVLLTHCEFRVGQDYRDLDKDGQKKMLAALSSSVKHRLVHAFGSLGKRKGNGRAQRARNPGKKSAKKALPSDDGLEAALLASGIQPYMLEEQHANEVLEYIRVEFLGSWGVEEDSERLVEENELEHRAEKDPGLKKFRNNCL